VACTDAGGTPVVHCAGDCDGDGTNDACQPLVDCNGNGEQDACDILTADCNGNGIPDDCDINGGLETDCDGNGAPDSCVLDAGGVGVDCNGTGTLDVCDIADGTSLDVDLNCIPDECDQHPSPLVEPVPFAKSRFISFVPVNAGCNVAIRVRLVSLTPPGRGADFAGFEDQMRWVGPPEMAIEDANSYEPFTAAQLQCDPYYYDWGPVGLLHVYGAAIMPESSYEVQFFDGDCGDVNNPACFSAPLVIDTGRWADVATPFEGEGTAQPDFRDLSQFVFKFRAVGGPIRVAAELDPNVINLQDVFVDFKDIAAAVSSFLGLAYDYAGPAACP